MNCQEALSLLYDVIDKEASEIDTQEVMAHLHKCRDCAGVYRLEQSVNDLLKAKLRDQLENPSVETLKARIITELDRVDVKNKSTESTAGPDPRENSSGGFRFGRVLTIAASIVVVVAAGYFGLRAFDDHAFYVPMERAHWTAAENVDAYQSSVATSITRNKTQQNLNYDVLPAVDEFELVGGTVEEVDGFEVAHYLYKHDDQVVSVFVLESEMMSLPDDLIATMVNRNGIEFYDHRCRGCRLVYHRSGNALVVTATTDGGVELLEFVPDRLPARAI